MGFASRVVEGLFFSTDHRQYWDYRQFRLSGEAAQPEPAPAPQPAPQDAPSIWTSGGMWNEGMLKDLETPAYIRNKGRR